MGNSLLKVDIAFYLFNMMDMIEVLNWCGHPFNTIILKKMELDHNASQTNVFARGGAQLGRASGAA